VGDPLDKYTESLLKSIDKAIKKKYKISLVEVLADPAAHASVEDIGIKLANAGEYFQSQIDKMIERAKKGGKIEHDGALKAGELTRNISSYISASARQNKVPILRPRAIELADYGKDYFYVNEMDKNLIDFIDRLLLSSKFVIDSTRSYDDYSIGSWLFAGDRDYVIEVHHPKNSISLLRNSELEVARMVKEASDSIKGL
jgi:hypothetical protein